MSSGAADICTSSIKRIRIGKRGKADGTAEIPDLTVTHPLAPSQLEGESPTVGHGHHTGRRSRPSSPESGRSRTEGVYEAIVSRVSRVGNVLTNWISLRPRFASGSPSKERECHEQTPTSDISRTAHRHGRTCRKPTHEHLSGESPEPIRHSPKIRPQRPTVETEHTQKLTKQSSRKPNHD